MNEHVLVRVSLVRNVGRVQIPPPNPNPKKKVTRDLGIKMKEVKEKHLVKLDSEITNFYSHLTENTTLKGDNKGIEGIIALRQLAESMHEYPFNLHMLAKVGSSAILPLLIVVIQRIAESGLGQTP